MTTVSYEETKTR